MPRGQNDQSAGPRGRAAKVVEDAPNDQIPAAVAQFLQERSEREVSDAPVGKAIRKIVIVQKKKTVRAASPETQESDEDSAAIATEDQMDDETAISPQDDMPGEGVSADLSETYSGQDSDDEDDVSGQVNSADQNDMSGEMSTGIHSDTNSDSDNAPQVEMQGAAKDAVQAETHGEIDSASYGELSHEADGGLQAEAHHVAEGESHGNTSGEADSGLHAETHGESESSYSQPEIMSEEHGATRADATHHIGTAASPEAAPHIESAARGKADRKTAAIVKVETAPAVAATPAAVTEVAAVAQAAPKKDKKARKAAEAQAETAAAPEVEAESELGTFAALGLSEPIVRAVADLGYETPTPIQARTIPILLSGRDLIGQAQTGTGKTAAFALPIIQKLDATRMDTQAVVLAPTRELAVQVAGAIHDLAKHTRLRVVPVYGGQPIDRQFRALREGAHIVVGTPGRVLDHLRRGTLSLANVKVCVLDEADEMLALGFVDEMEAILAELPEQRQMAFFSATMPPRIVSLTKQFLHNPQHISIETKRRTVETTNQRYYDVPPGKKLEALARVLDMETPGPTIVFCRTRQETNDLADALRLRGYGAEALHGDMNQGERDRVMRRFREGQADLLVATDVAARGLDIETVTHVINYDIPWDVEQYIHRIGRTGRAGRTGDAITLVEGRERRQLQFIERMIGAAIKPARIPTAADISARRRDVFKESLVEALTAGQFDGHLSTVEELSTEYDPAEIAAAALQMLWQSRHITSDKMAAEIAADFEQPERGMTRIFIGLGRQDGLRPADVVGAIANETGLTARAIGAIDIMDRSAFVEVPIAHADKVITALRRTKIIGRKATVQFAQPADSQR